MTGWQKFEYWVGGETVFFSIHWGFIGLFTGLLIGGLCF